MVIKFEIERLINYALQQGLIESTDVTYVRNHFLYLFGEKSYKNYKIEESLEYPDSILNNMYQYTQEHPQLKLGLNEDMIKCNIMDILVPRPSTIHSKFKHAYVNYDANQALEYFYQLNIASNYIKMADVAKNHHWLSKTPYGELEITINLSKPEKDPKEIAAAKLYPASDYPKCLLCAENEGFSGDYSKPSRFTHRVIPLCLNSENWFFQFSPYVYYNQHSIVFSAKHRDMQISQATIKSLFDFVDYIPSYIIGANADLPIVGGSILSHDHFQSGKHQFPMDKAIIRNLIAWTDYPDVKGYILEWPLSVIRLEGNRDDLLELSDHILKQWITYTDKSVDIIAYSTERHNTLNPIVRKLPPDKYQLNLILRNNRKSETYPDGIFHPHQELHHIKKENIGLIEAMGLAILPGRLDSELKLISQLLLLNCITYIEEIDINHSLYQHKDWLFELITQHPAFTEATIQRILQHEVAKKFMQVLECSGVFKNTDEGKHAFNRFIKYSGGSIV